MTAPGPSGSEAIAALAADYWSDAMDRAPTTALLLGDTRNASEWEDLSRGAEDDHIATLRRIAAAAEEIDPELLTPDERITRAVLISEATGEANELGFRMAEFAVNHTTGLHISLLQTVGQIRVTDGDTANAVVAKWSKFGAMFDQAIFRLRQGVAKDRTPPRFAVERSIAQIGDYLASDVAADPFASLPPPPDFTEAQAAEWRNRLTTEVVETIRPAYRKYRDALADEVLQHARSDERTGVRWLEDGEALYAEAIRRHTSLELTPLAIHQIGLDEMAALDDQYRDLGSRAIGINDVEEILQHLRSDPSLRFETSDQVREAAAMAMARANAAIPDWFGRLPRAECVMADIPGPGAEDAPLAFYYPPATDGSRPGTFFINISEPTSKTKYESEALAFHEGIPGHHLQLALAQELDSIPEFRRNAFVTVYIEGWGLYTERLADEMGLYSGDLARLGILSFDSWRAGRLIVDTGMHALGWSRQEAIDYLAEHTPLAPNNIANEVDRYIGWPGQALAYKMGQRELFKLRDEAKATMGSRFDIKGFHDTVLGSGAVPLGVLGDLVREWAGAHR